MQAKGGFPEQFVFTVPEAGVPIEFPFETIALQLSVTGANDVRVYFSEEAFVADPTGAAATGAGDRWTDFPGTTGFYNGPAAVDRFWARGLGGDSQIQLIAYRKKF